MTPDRTRHLLALQSKPEERGDMMLKRMTRYSIAAPVSFLLCFLLEPAAASDLTQSVALDGDYASEFVIGGDAWTAFERGAGSHVAFQRPGFEGRPPARGDFRARSAQRVRFRKRCVQTHGPFGDPRQGGRSDRGRPAAPRRSERQRVDRRRSGVRNLHFAHERRVYLRDERAARSDFPVAGSQLQ